MRTARRGSSAGGQFYGCSDYPHCKGTRDLNIEADDEEVSSVLLPRIVQLADLADGRQVQLVECAALPREGVRALVSAEVETSVRRSFAQWQLVLPSRRNVSARQIPVTLGIAEKILKRGTIVPLSPGLEARVIAAVGQPSESTNWTDSVGTIAASRGVATLPPRFDSQHEKRFFDNHLASLAGLDMRPWSIVQAPLEPFVSDNGQEVFAQRVDVLIAHPLASPVVVEIDGQQHQQTLDLDAKRDAVLRSSGIQVVRIPTWEIDAGDGPGLRELRAFAARLPVNKSLDERTDRIVTLTKRSHQLQLAVLEAMLLGIVDWSRPELRVHLAGDMPDGLGSSVLADLSDLLKDIADLYGEIDNVPHVVVAPTEIDSDLVVGLNVDVGAANRPSVSCVDTYLPVSASADLHPAAQVNIGTVKRGPVERLLHRIFGFQTFRPGQFEAVVRTLQGKDSLVLLPTGAGKSVAFQLPALLRAGVCVVVDPLVSLIDDQIENLHLAGIDRTVQITGQSRFDVRSELLQSLSRGEFGFCYVAPERFQSEEYRSALRTLTTHTPIACVAIDEVHCISEWGHDFRTAYLNLARIAREYGAHRNVPPPLCGLTGTASRSVLKDVQRETGIMDFDAIVTPKSFDRPELSFETIACRSGEKMARLKGVLQSIPRHFSMSPQGFFQARGRETHAGLVFCPFVNGRFGVTEVATDLSKALGQPVPFYSGTVPKGGNKNQWGKRRKTIARTFKHDRVSLMACTKAFGMGIDKPNVRYTLHYGLPTSLEAFYQEAGRAGRDGNPARCGVLFSNDDTERTRTLLNPNTDVQIVRTMCDSVGWDDADDITRSLWFHNNSFQGLNEEVGFVVAMLDDLGDTSRRARRTVGFDKKKEGDKNIREKALHRLLTIGVVDDYTVDYNAGEFNAVLSGAAQDRIAECVYKYIAAYQRARAKVVHTGLKANRDEQLRQFTVRAARSIIEFVYDVIERSRRSALSEMLAACEASRDEHSFRKRLLAYLESSPLGEAIEEILGAERGGMEEAVLIIESVCSAVDAAELRGQAARALEAYPDQPGLRLLRAASEAMCSDVSEATVRENAEAAVGFAMSKYGIDSAAVYKCCEQAVRAVSDARPGPARAMVAGYLLGSPDRRGTSRYLLANLPTTIVSPALSVLLGSLSDRVKQVTEGGQHVR